MERFRLRVCVWLLLVSACGLGLGGGRALARVQAASDKIADNATCNLIDLIPETGTDLPAFLARPQDVYLLITAGAAYTDVRVLADPGIAPLRLGRALEAAEAGTPLADTAVTWSADSYSAACLVWKQGRLGRRASANTVPLGALAGGLRRAGFVPHLLLRVPLYAARAGLPPSPYVTRRFRWYDARALAGRSSVTVRAALSLSLAAMWPFLLLPLIPLVGLTNIFIASRLERDERKPLEARRRLFQSLTFSVPMLAIALIIPLTIFGLRAPGIAAMADLWLGNSSAMGILLPAFMIVPVSLPLVLVAAKRREVKLFGRPAAAISWLSEEEKALQKRMTRWSTLPHLIGAILLGGVMFLVPHRSPLYSVVHPVSQLVIISGAGLVSLLFRKQVAALTRRTRDDDLTFRARRFGQVLGARPQDVWVEESSRAAHFAAAHRDRGDHLVVSQKMRAEFTTAEMDFVLAGLVARLIRRRASVSWSQLMFLPLMLVPVCLPLWLFSSHSPSRSALFLSPWFPPALIGWMILSVSLMLVSSCLGVKEKLRQEEEADRRALEVTGDLAAAESALSKMDAETLPPMTAAALTSSSARPDQATATTRLKARRLALQRAAGTLQDATSSDAGGRRMSPFGVTNTETLGK